VWFRRARFVIVSPDSRVNLARRQAETPLIALCKFPEPALRRCPPDRDTQLDRTKDYDDDSSKLM
jgi:hypothetical protein